MPYKIVAKPSGKYQVSSPTRIHSKGTTLAKAKAQERLLNAIEHNPNFKPYSKKK